MKLQPWACALFWLATLAVLALTLAPGHYLPDKGPFNLWDKAQHAMAFGVLTALGLVAWPARAQRFGLLAGLLMLGGAIEVAQHLTGWRHGEWADWAADAVGVAIAAALGLLRQRAARRPRP
jgi:VanZ family protein